MVAQGTPANTRQTPRPRWSFDIFPLTHVGNLMGRGNHNKAPNVSAPHPHVPRRFRAARIINQHWLSCGQWTALTDTSTIPINVWGIQFTATEISCCRTTALLRQRHQKSQTEIWRIPTATLLIVFLRKIYFFHLLLPARVLWRLGEGHEVPPPLQSMTPHVAFCRRHVSSPDSCNTTCFTDQQEVAASPFLDLTIVCLFQLLFSSTCLQLHTQKLQLCFKIFLASQVLRKWHIRYPSIHFPSPLLLPAAIRLCNCTQ